MPRVCTEAVIDVQSGKRKRRSTAVALQHIKHNNGIDAPGKGDDQVLGLRYCVRNNGGTCRFDRINGRTVP